MANLAEELMKAGLVKMAEDTVEVALDPVFQLLRESAPNPQIADRWMSGLAYGIRKNESEVPGKKGHIYFDKTRQEEILSSKSKWILQAWAIAIGGTGHEPVLPIFPEISGATLRFLNLSEFEELGMLPVLSGFHFKESNLHRAVFGAHLVGCSFENCDLTGVQVTGILEDCVFRGSDCRHWVTAKGKLNNVRFLGSDCRKSIYGDCISVRWMSGTKLFDSDWTGERKGSSIYKDCRIKREERTKFKAPLSP